MILQVLTRSGLIQPGKPGTRYDETTGQGISSGTVAFAVGGFLTFCGLNSGQSEDWQPPSPVGNEQFAALLTNSPFNRALDLSDSLVLTGIATIDSESVATILNKESKEIYVVSADANVQGWRMVAIEGNRNDLETVTASISLTGGEVVDIRFADHQLKPGESKPGGAESQEGRGFGVEGRERRDENGGKGGKGKGKGKGEGERGERPEGSEGRDARAGKGGGKGGKGGSAQGRRDEASRAPNT